MPFKPTGGSGGGGLTIPQIIAGIELQPTGSKLDATLALDNLPGANTPYVVTDFNSGGAGWYELYRIQGGTENHFAADFLVRMASADRTEFARITVSGNLNENNDGYLKISEKTVRTSDSTVTSAFTQIRLLKDTPTSTTARVLAYIDSTSPAMVGNLLSLYDAPQLTETYGSFNAFDLSSVPTAVTIWEEDMSEWYTKRIKENIAGFASAAGIKSDGTAKLEISGNDVQITGEDFAIDTTANVNIDSPMVTIASAINLNGSVVMSGDATVTGDITVTGSIDAPELNTVIEQVEDGDGFKRRLKTINERSSYSHGDTMSEEDANYMLGYLGRDAYFSNASDRIMPIFYEASNARRGFMTGVVASDPVIDSGFAEIVIPSELLSYGAQLGIRSRSVSSSGLRRVWVYQDTISATNELSPIHGSAINESGVLNLVVFEVEDQNKDLRIVGSRQLIETLVISEGNFDTDTGITDAPADGTPYNREDNAWVTALTDAPSDGTAYNRQDGNWIAATSGGGIADAPSDGKLYGRKDATWEEVSNTTITSQADIDLAGGKWIDIATFQALPASSENAAAFVRFDCKNGTGEFLFHTTLYFSALRGTGEVGDITIIHRESKYATPVDAKYRIVKDTSAVGSGLRFQFYSGLNGSYTFGATLLSAHELGAGAELRVAEYTVTGSEDELKELDVTGWQALNRTRGSTGGDVGSSYGSADTNGSRLEFSNQGIEHYVGDSLTLESTSEGTVISGSAAGTFVTPTDVMTGGTSAIVSPRYISGSEFGPIETRVTNDGMTYVAGLVNHAGGGPVISAMRSNDSTQLLDFQIPNWLSHDNETIYLTLVVEAKGISNAFDGYVCMYDQTGTETQRITLPANGDNDATTTARLVVPVGSPRFSIGNRESAAVAIGIRSYHLELDMPEATLDNHLVAKFHSHTRAVSMPTVVDNGTRPFEAGDLRKDPLSGLLQERVGSGWNYLANVRFDAYTSPDFASYFADTGNGDPVAQGWSNLFPNRTSVVNGQYNYPALLKMTDDSTTERTEITRHLTSAAQGRMYNDGFQWDFVMRVDDGRAVNYIQVTNDYSGTAGRWIFAIDGTGTDLTVSDLGGSETADLGSKGKFVTFSIRKKEGTTAPVELYADDVLLFTLAFQTQSISEGLLLHTSGSSASDDEVFYLLSSSFFTLEGTARTLTRQEISENIRLHLNNATEVVVPKGTYTNGTTFTTIAGSNPVSVHGEDNEGQTFGGLLEFVVPPYHEVSWTQMAPIRGNTWATDVITRATPHSQGNELKVMVDDNGGAPIVTTRHGNYVEGITVTRVGTGEYRIVPDAANGHVFGFNNSYIAATGLDAGNSINANAWFATGYPSVYLFDDAGSPVDGNFSMDLIW